MKTHVNHSLGHWSCIDHCIVSDNVFNEILDNRVVDSNDNVSNHLPVELSFSVNVDTSKDSGNIHGSNNDIRSSIQWNKANEDDISNYKRVLDNILLCKIKKPAAPICSQFLLDGLGITHISKYYL